MADVDFTRRSGMLATFITALGTIIGCNTKVTEQPAVLSEESDESKTLDLPIELLRRLHKIGDLIEQKFPVKYDHGMGQLGLILSRKLKHGGYWCTPKNSLEFGNTGGDGVHFSLIQINGTVTEESPVVVGVPANSGEPHESNAIVGSSLINFIRFGLIRGYFAMEQLIYQRELTLKAYASAEWVPTEQSHHSVGLGVDESQKRVLQLVAKELNITPLSYNNTEFETLQKKYMPLLIF